MSLPEIFDHFLADRGHLGPVPTLAYLISPFGSLRARGRCSTTANHCKMLVPVVGLEPKIADYKLKNGSFAE